MEEKLSLKELKEELTECIKIIVEVQASTKSAHKRLDGFEKHTEAIIRMSAAVENQTDKITEIIDLLKEEKERNDTQDTRIEKLENKPGQLALKAWIFIIASGGSFLLGCLFNTLGGK
jgi:hypothetical protein